jgi:hypothetical protein
MSIWVIGSMGIFLYGMHRLGEGIRAGGDCLNAWQFLPIFKIDKKINT